MGIPKFYRWLSQRYPLINQSISHIIPEYDNLYLDFNGVIHRCTHPDDINPLENALTESDMIIKMFEYVQLLVSMIKPKKVLVIAVDGVAPRAKMNQQRSRRFRTAKDTAEAVSKAQKAGAHVPDHLFDSNCITPGTEFMQKLNDHFAYFIKKKISEDPLWKNLLVVFSGHDTPGEGEHKIMDFIRKMKSRDGYDPNTTHCMYGLDADLIMLSLVTHEPHFTLLRENVYKKWERPNKHKAPKAPTSNSTAPENDFQLLHISLLREYLNEEFRLASTDDFHYDLERIIDDFVFICYFIGNDFLPNLPFLDIANNSLDQIFDTYKTCLKETHQYLTIRGHLDLERCEDFIARISRIEQESLNFGGTHKYADEAFGFLVDDQPVAGDEDLNLPAENTPVIHHQSRKHQSAPHKESAQSEPESGPDTDGPAEEEGEPAPRKSRKTQELEQRLASLGFVGHHEKHGFEEIHDDNAWKDQYYLLKFNHSITEQDFHRQLQFEYLRGLCWVLKYYYDGCASWGWFYPYHYAPLASDLTRLTQHQNVDEFDLGAPFLPFQQLLSVLPRASKTLLPFAYQALMTNADSPIYEFYPTDFKVDINGKKNDWEGVVLIPFIDEALLRKACDTITPEQLTEGERSRNINSEYHLLFKYNESLDLTVPNTLPEVPALYHNRTELQRLILPTHLIEFKLCEGVQTGINGPPGFPTFYSLPYRSEHKIVGVTVFSFPSKAESLVIHLLRPPLWESEFSEYPPELDILPQENVTEAELDAAQMDQEIHSLRTSQQLQDKAKQITQQLADKYLGKKIFTYPYHTECRVAEVSCEYITLKSRDETHIQERHTWFKTKKEVALRFLFKQAVEVGDIQVLFKLEPIQGMRLLPTGQKQKLFDPEKTEWYPFQAVVEHVKQPDHRYDETEVPIEKIVPLGAPAIITEPKYFGAKALVRGFVEPNTTSKNPRRHAGIKLSNKLIKVEFAPIPVPPTFAKENYLTVHYEYFTVDEVARRLHLSKDVISQITSSVFIIPRTDIGLRLKFSQRSQKVAGYSNRNRGWEFTERAIAMIGDYYAKFPQVFKALEHRKFDDKLRVDEIFHENSRNNLRALVEYLNSLHLNSLPVVPLNYSHMSEEAIRKTEIELEEYLKNLETTPKMKTLSRDMDISQLQIPVSDLFHVQSRAAFHVGDQICYIRDGFGPAFGSYGFVTAVDRHSGYINAMFEHEFIGGTTFHGVLNKARGLEFIEPRYALCITAISDWYRYSRSSRDNVQHTVSLEQFLRDRHEDRPYRKTRDNTQNQSGGGGNGNPSLRNSYNGRQRAPGTPSSPMRGESKPNDRPNKEPRQKFDQDSDKPGKQPRNQKQQQKQQKHRKQKSLERVEASGSVPSAPAAHVVANVELSVPAPVAKVDQPQPIANVPQAIPVAQVNVATKLSAIEAPLLASVNIAAKPSVPAGPSSDEINALGVELLATLQPGAQNLSVAVEASESPRVAKAEGAGSPAVPAASGESNPIEKLFYSGPPKPTSQPKLNPNPQQILLQPWLKNQTTLPNAAFDPRAAQAYYSGMPIGSHTPPQWNDPNFRPPAPTSVPFPQPPPGAFPFPVAQYPGQIPGQVPLGFVPVPGAVAPRSGSNPGFLIPSQIVAAAPGQANPQSAPAAPVPGAPGPGPVVQEQSQDLNWQQKHLMSRTDLPEQAQLDSQLSKRRDTHPRGEKKNRGKHHPRGGDHHRERNDHN